MSVRVDLERHSALGTTVSRCWDLCKLRSKAQQIAMKIPRIASIAYQVDFDSRPPLLDADFFAAECSLPSGLPWEIAILTVVMMVGRG